MRDLDGAPPLIVHQAEAAGERHPYEVLFRSAHKLLMDSATSEFLFCLEFWAGDAELFREVFAPAVAAVEESLALFLPNCHDLVGISLMLRINHEHQLIMSRRRAPCLDAYLDKVSLTLWPRFKLLLDAQLASIRNAALQTESLQAQPVTRRCAELVSSLQGMHSVGGADGQAEAQADRLRGALFELLGRMAKQLGQRKQRMVFLVNNFEAVLAVLREAAKGEPGCEGAEASPTFLFFNEQLLAQVHLLVDDELADQFNPLITFVQRAEGAYKAAEAGGAPRCTLPQYGPSDAEPVLRDFSVRWQTSLEEIHGSIFSAFGNTQRSLDILQRTLSQLLLFYTRLTGPEGVLVTYCGPEGAVLCRSAVPTQTILAEIKRLLHR